MPTHFVTMDTPIGVIKLISDEQHLQSISFDAVMADCTSNIPDILIIAKSQLEEYFGGIRQTFDFLIDPEGSEFQQRVWKRVVAVRYGSTSSYLRIAREIGSAGSCRAVGMANGKNPLPIIIPCHRIIGQNGKLTGYAGGLDRKKWLLLHEQKFSGNGRLF